MGEFWSKPVWRTQMWIVPAILIFTATAILLVHVSIEINNLDSRITEFGRKIEEIYGTR